ncbi:MAG: hypothetical protein CL916_03340 [Deltaproteobacteria bacterium]|nr:hypothetical protein [Deltaproteobacteria bacterium]
MTQYIYSQLEILAQTPHGRLVFQNVIGWVVLQSYARPHQALCEIAGNTYLPKENKISLEQENLVKQYGYTKRRGDRTIGKIIQISTSEERDTIFTELTNLFPQLYQESFEECTSTLYTDVLSGITNPKFTKTMRALSQKRTHDLRLEVYRMFINATFLLAINQDESPREVEKLANLPCFAVFTDDKSIRSWDPRGTLWKKMYGFEVINTIMKHNPGSLIINPRGNISGELYKNELQTLAKATKRFSPKRPS